MKYINIDTVNNKILGVNPEPIEEDGWYACSDEVYEIAISTNTNKLNITINEDGSEITKDNLSIIETTLNEAVRKMLLKLNISCREYIEYGIVYNDKHYTYKIEDQCNYNELNLLKDSLETIPIKAEGEDNYTFISKEEFETIYNKLIYNKYYQLMYLKYYEEYLNTLKTVKSIYDCIYETLPKKYITKLNKSLKNLKEVTNGE